MTGQSQPRLEHLLGKFVLTQKNKVGRIVSVCEGEDALMILFIIRPTRNHIWLVKSKDLLGATIFDTEAEASSAQASADNGAQTRGPKHQPSLTFG
jgi:hypothetical protein